jgi:hypothetical protein
MSTHAVEVLKDVIEQKRGAGVKEAEEAEEVLGKTKEAQMIVEEEDE